MQHQAGGIRLLLISYYFLVDGTGALRPRAMSRYLPENGIDVYVLTSGAKGETIRYEDHVIAVKDFSRHTLPWPLFYLWRVWQIALRLLGRYRTPCERWRSNVVAHADEIIRHAKPDAILATYPQVEALEVGLLFSKRYGVPLIADFRDGLLYEPLDEVALRNSIVREHYEKLEADLAKQSGLILTVSEPISAYFRSRYTHGNVVTIPNGFDHDDVKPDMSVDLPKGVINIVHTGRLGASRAGTSGKGRGIDALSMALEILSAGSSEITRKFQLHFVGVLSREEKKCLIPWISRGVVKIWGHQPRSTALGLQKKSDFLLLITAPDKPSIVTGKLFEYLAADKPILALTRGTEAARIITEAGVGIIVEPDKPEEIAQAIERCVSGVFKDNVVRNDAAVAIFSRKDQMANLAKRIASMLRGRAGSELV